MKPVHLRFKRSFYIRHGIVGGMLSFFCFVIVTMSLRHHGGILAKFAPLLFIGPWFAMIVREHRIAACLLDENGVTRNDGRRFSWSDFKEARKVHIILTGGQQGALNHVDIIFANGFARILPFVLENAFDALRFLEQRQNVPVPTPPASAPQPSAVPAAKHEPPSPAVKPAGKCTTCSELGQYHRGLQTGGREEEDTFLPDAASALKNIKDVQPGRNRTPVLRQCPECGAYFLFEVTYEYLATGSEDEQVLTRLSDEKAREILNS